MNTGDALLRACLEKPDDDTPRLVYADWLQENGDPARAEFIRVQIEVARHGRSGYAPTDLRSREKELLAAHEAEWKPLPPGMREHAGFDRGLLAWGNVGTDEEAAAVARCPEILQISAGGEGFTDVGLAHLAALPYLEELKLQQVAVTSNGMRALARLPRLRRMYLQDVTVTGAWFHHFRDAPRLVRVWAHSVGGDGITPEEWAAWEEARAERFRRSSVEDRQRDAVAFLFPDYAWEFDTWEGLRRVGLIQSRITDADVELIAAHPEMQALDLYQTRITNRALRYLSGLPELRGLSLGYNDIDNLDWLAGMTQLRDLNLIGMHVYRADGEGEYPLTDAGTAALSTLTGLESLCLSFNPITDATLARLTGLTNLRKLELESVEGVTDAGLFHLRRLKKLEHLDVGRTAVTADGVEELLARLPGLKIEGVGPAD